MLMNKELVKTLSRKLVLRARRRDAHKAVKRYLRKFERYSFTDGKCNFREQYEASITRLYHTIEKGLSYEDYRAGFGKQNVDMLVSSMDDYAASGFDVSAFFYETALSCLFEYVRKNREYGYVDNKLEKRIEYLPGKPNDCGGVVAIHAPDRPETMTFEQLLTSRHSIRHFSKRSVDMALLEDAIKLAQHTPSACNRQSWKTRVISDKSIIHSVLENQNGNRGFGQEFDKLLVITSDLRSQQRSRELFQAYIDGGMYAANVLNCLFSKGIGSVPLSAALTSRQEEAVRGAVDIDDAEVLILFIGVGFYPNGEFMTTRSERKPIEVEIL